MNVQDRMPCLRRVSPACRAHAPHSRSGDTSRESQHGKEEHSLSTYDGFRVTDETWFAIQREISNTDLTPRDWCRLVVLDSLNREVGLTKKEHIFFDQSVPVRYLIANGFQLLADDRLTSDECKKLRMFSKEKIDVISDRALRALESETRNNTE